MDAPRLPDAVELRWREAWGDDVVASARRQIAKRPALDLSFVDDAEAKAFAEQVGGKSLASRHARLNDAGSVTELPGFVGGRWWVQDLAASLPARLIPIVGVGLLVSLFLIFIARPVSVYTSLALSRLPFREQTLVAWVGLRGAVPIVLATFPVLAGIQKADTIFHLVFFIALTSVLLQGPPIPWMTRLLRLDRAPQEGRR
jgi:hypothetical protein